MVCTFGDNRFFIFSSTNRKQQLALLEITSFRRTSNTEQEKPPLQEHRDKAILKASQEHIATHVMHCRYRRDKRSEDKKGSITLGFDLSLKCSHIGVVAGVHLRHLGAARLAGAAPRGQLERAIGRLLEKRGKGRRGLSDELTVATVARATRPDGRKARSARHSTIIMDRQGLRSSGAPRLRWRPPSRAQKVDGGAGAPVPPLPRLAQQR